MTRPLFSIISTVLGVLAIVHLGSPLSPSSCESFRVSAVSDDIATLAWSRPVTGDPTTGYLIHCRAAGTSTWTRLTGRGFLMTTVDYPGLAAGSDYECRCRAWSEGEVKAKSAPVYITLSTALPPTARLGLPGNPIGLTASWASPTSIRFDWAAPIDGEIATGYQVDYRVRLPNGNWDQRVIIASAQNPQSHTWFEATGLSPKQDVQARVKSVNALGAQLVGDGAWEIGSTLDATPEPSPAPTPEPPPSECPTLGVGESCTFQVDQFEDHFNVSRTALGPGFYLHHALIWEETELSLPTTPACYRLSMAVVVRYGASATAFGKLRDSTSQVLNAYSVPAFNPTQSAPEGTEQAPRGGVVCVFADSNLPFTVEWTFERGGVDYVGTFGDGYTVVAELETIPMMPLSTTFLTDSTQSLGATYTPVTTFSSTLSNFIVDFFYVFGASVVLFNKIDVGIAELTCTAVASKNVFGFLVYEYAETVSHGITYSRQSQGSVAKSEFTYETDRFSEPPYELIAVRFGLGGHNYNNKTELLNALDGMTFDLTCSVVFGP